MRTPAEIFDPRGFAREEFAERGLAEKALPVTIRRWLTTDAPLTGLVAQSLSVMLATSPEYWLNLERSFREHPSVGACL